MLDPSPKSCYRAAYMQRGLSYGKCVCLSVRPSVRLSVCPSHAWIVTKRTKVPQRFLYRMKGKFMYFFVQIEWLVGDAPLHVVNPYLSLYPCPWSWSCSWNVSVFVSVDMCPWRCPYTCAWIRFNVRVLFLSVDTVLSWSCSCRGQVSVFVYVDRCCCDVIVQCYGDVIVKNQ